MFSRFGASSVRMRSVQGGLAIDRQVTVILSQGDEPRPLCGIYFNLHSPYQKDSLPTTVKLLGKTKSSASEDEEA